MSERLSASEFARREGCDEKQVRRGLERGALVRGQDGLIDASLIGSWRKPNRRTLQKAVQGPRATAATDTVMRDGEPPGEAANCILDAPLDLVSLADALRAKEYWNAKLRQLEYEQKAGELIELALAEQAAFDLCRSMPDAWLAWPSKVAPFMAAELDVDIDRLTGLLAEAVYQQLVELSEARADFSADG